MTQREITLWVDERWCKALEKHLLDGTVAEKLEEHIDELVNRLPENVYERISSEIWQEREQAKMEAEAARRFAVLHVTEDGSSTYFIAEEKLEMENRVLDICPDAVMLRADWMYDYVSNKGNYFKNILNAEGDTLLCSRQFRGVSYVKEAVEAMRLVWNIPGGSYNFGSETQKSMYEITKEFVAFLEKKIEVEEGTERHNLWMDCSKIKKYGIAFSEVTEGLKKCARDYGMEKKKDRGI